jgi:hypothetical protein
MRWKTVFLSAAIILTYSMAARSEQGSSGQAAGQKANAISGIPGQDCSGQSESPRNTGQALDRDPSSAQSQPDPAGDTETADSVPVSVNIDQDLKILHQRQSELAQCILESDESGEPQETQGACVGELLLKFEMRHDGEPERDVPIGRLSGSSAFFYESGMTIDADGAPNAYHPENVGLDDLANAGTPGRWEGLAKNADGEPYIQGPEDPFPGYYVSATALADRSKPASDPTRYVDASRIPFVVLPGGMARQLGARPGDFAVVFNQRNGKSSYAIFGDVGPADRIGEGSMALAENLGIRPDARNGGTRRGVVYLVFPGSGNGRPRTVEEIDAEGQRLLLAWEASISPAACAAQGPVRRTEGDRAAN